MWRKNENYNKICEAIQSGKDFAVFDVETTGLSIKNSYIIEFAAKKYRIIGNRFVCVDSIEVYIKPPIPISAKITEITKITNEMLEDKLPEKVVFPHIASFLEGTVWVVYNERFDVPILRAMAERMHSKLAPDMVLDVLDMARDLVPKEQSKSHKLGAIAELYNIQVNNGLDFHNAIFDAEVTAKLFFVFIYEYAEQKKKSTPSKKRKAAVLDVSPWKRGKLNRIYVNTNFGSVYYDIVSKTWEDKDLDMEQFDMDNIREQVFRMTNCESEEELRKYKGSYAG